MDWAIDEAQQKLSEILNAATKEPQWIHDREQRVAVVVDANLFQEFLAWQQNHPQTLANAFAELRRLCGEENYTLETPTRVDRPNPFADTLHDSAV
ncbi:MAG: prevent-host-death protein [Cyanobacteria bacterium RM1_2_2]|nr:prevent-host-death protein [Cyanobacteria bacterium RM1_2_2]